MRYSDAVSLRNRCRRARRRDFDRVYFADTHLIEPEGWLVWNVHPFADELEILERLQMTPSMCRSVDLYWRTRLDVYFVSLEIRSEIRPLWTGSRSTRGMLAVHIDLPGPHIDRPQTFEALRRVHARGLPRRWKHRPPARV